jgi:hypothetical protein
MTINFSTNKDGNNSLYINHESLSSTDSIYWDEAVIFRDVDKITIFGVISSASKGIVCFKEKSWRPDFQECTLKVYAQKKQQWDSPTSKFITVDVCKEEAHLYLVLQEIQKNNGSDTILKGTLNPWLNPYFWELGTDETSVNISAQFVGNLCRLTPHSSPKRLQSEKIEQARGVSNKKTGGSFGYQKGESELERLSIRYEWLHSQFKDLYEYNSLYDLAQQIEAAQNGSLLTSLGWEQTLCNVTKTLLELIKLVMT